MSDFFNAIAMTALGFAWLACIWFSIRNLKEAGKSAQWVWLSIFNPIVALIILVVSYNTLQTHKAALARQEAQDERERRQQEEDNKRRATEQYEAAQGALALRLNQLVASSTQTAATLPELVESAEQTIDLAEREFSDGAFAPFWDAVEDAANELATFDATIQTLISNSRKHSDEASRLQTAAPPFRLGIDTLPDATHTANRMRAIVRQAQKDFHFATIYEQRKTNQLLVAGFSSLGQAIVELSDRLDSSLDRLASTVNIAISDLSSDITSAQQHMTDKLSSELETTREQAEAESAATRKHEQSESEMLDNIQRRRRPRPEKFRDGKF